MGWILRKNYGYISPEQSHKLLSQNNVNSELLDNNR